MNISEIIESQKEHFLSGATLSLGARRENLKRLKHLLKENEDKIAEAQYI